MFDMNFAQNHSSSKIPNMGKNNVIYENLYNFRQFDSKLYLNSVFCLVDHSSSSKSFDKTTAEFFTIEVCMDFNKFSDE